MNGNEAKLRDYLKRVTGDLRKVRRRLRDVEEQAREPIAIVGMACRYPGGVRSAGAALGAAGRRAASRQLRAAHRPRLAHLTELYDPDPGPAPAPATCAAAASSTGRDTFDAGFFGISPREALAIDPQQRLLLETCLGGAGGRRHDPLRRAAPACSSVSASALAAGRSRAGDPQSDLDAYFGPGAGRRLGPRRLSLGLSGPALSLDTACSSSLVALHLACQSLRCGRVRSLALAGGVTRAVDADAPDRVRPPARRSPRTGAASPSLTQQTELLRRGGGRDRAF